MVAARAEVAGSAALLPVAEAEASVEAAVAAAAGPTAGVAGGTCNCNSSADYTREGDLIGRRERAVALHRYCTYPKIGVRYVTIAHSLKPRSREMLRS